MYIVFFSYIKTSKASSEKYYQKHKETLQINVPQRHQVHFKKEKNKKHQYSWWPEEHLSEGENQKLVQYRKKFFSTQKNKNVSQIKAD